MAQEIIYLTAEGYKKIKDELEHMRSVERPAISAAIAEARDKGDLSENAEYDAAREAQGLLEMRIAKLEDTMANARVIDESKIDKSKVQILSKVTLLNHNNQKQMTYTIVAEQTDHAIDGGSLSFDISSADRSNHFNAYASFQNTARKSYYGSKQDLDAYGTTHDLTLAAGMQYVHAFRKLLFMPSELTLGTEYSYDDLSDRSIGYDIRTDQAVHIVGAYLQNEWKTRKWSLLIGGRLDKHNLVDHAIFSPRANVRFNPSESVNLRVSYAGGYRAPQAFDEDMHIAIVGGKRVRIRLADDLKEERSHSVSLSADLYHTFGRVQTNLLVEGFYTRLDDVFALRDIEDTADGGKIKERYNGSGATVRGLNAEGRAVFTRWFELQAGVTWQRSRYVEPEYWSEDAEVPPVRRMFRTPDLYGYFTASLKPLRNFTADVTGTCTGEMLVQHMAGSGVERDVAVTTPAFCDVNLRLAYDLRVYKEITLQLYGGVQNLFNAYQKDFDKGVDRDSGYIYGPSLPRSWFIGAKVSF